MPDLHSTVAEENRHKTFTRSSQGVLPSVAGCSLADRLSTPRAIVTDTTSLLNHLSSPSFNRRLLIPFFHLQPLIAPPLFLHHTLQKSLHFLLLIVLHQKMGFPWDRPIHRSTFLKTRALLLRNENASSLRKKTRTALLPPAPRLLALCQGTTRYTIIDPPHRP
jgi:hypothetical protein